MLHSMFDLPLPVLEKVLRAAVVYAFLIAALRVAGKRELAQLDSVDFVLLLAVANAVQNGIIGPDDSVTGGLIGASTLFALNGAIAFLLFRSVKARKMIEGTDTVLIEEGKMVWRNLKKERITEDQLRVAIQRQGADDITEVDRAVLEPGGSIVIRKRKTPPTQEAIRRLEAKIDALTAHLERSPGQS